MVWVRIEGLAWLVGKTINIGKLKMTRTSSSAKRL
jgi:hypothetical protein